MKRRLLCCGMLVASYTAFAQLPPQIKHVVILIQENRTPDNLFHGLGPKCPIPKGATGLKACMPSPVTDSCYDISPCGISNQKTTSNPNGEPVPITLTPVPLAGSADPNHSHQGFVDMCDPDPAQAFACRNDGAYLTSCGLKDGKCTVPTSSYGYVDNVPVINYDGSHGHLLDPYLTFAKQYGWGNFMYQTNQGPSYPAHQFLFSGTSSFNAMDDAEGIYVSENFNGKVVGKEAGCLLPNKGIGYVVSSAQANNPGNSCVDFPGNVIECQLSNVVNTVGGEALGDFCYPHDSMADLLDPAHITWKYYAPSPGSIWTAPDSIRKICVPEYVTVNGVTTLECTGREWNANVDASNKDGANNRGTEILKDIDACNLADVNWVIPDGAWSDHAGSNDMYGPSWVAAVINGIGTHAVCGAGTKNAGEKLWDTTAIIVTWDDWGGWSDNQPALYLSKLPCVGDKPCLADYQYGFRVPLVVVSAYTPAGVINNVPHDFGSILRFVEGVNGIREGELGFADARAQTDLREFFTLTSPRSYEMVPAEYPAKCFTETTQTQGCFSVGSAVDPDDE